MPRRAVESLGAGQLGRLPVDERRLRGGEAGEEPQVRRQLVTLGERLEAAARPANSAAGSGRRTNGGFGMTPMAEGSGSGAPVFFIQSSRTARATWWGAPGTARYSFSGAVSAGRRLPVTTSRSQRRWCRQAQPPVTLPRVIALIVPRTQIAA